jgi:hypothetical protein
MPCPIAAQARRTAAAGKCPLKSIHSTLSNPGVVPIDTVLTTARNNVTTRHIAPGIRRLLPTKHNYLHLNSSEPSLERPPLQIAVPRVDSYGGNAFLGRVMTGRQYNSSRRCAEDFIVTHPGIFMGGAAREQDDV